MLLVQGRADCEAGYRGREVVRAESGCPGVGQQETVGEEEEDRK